MTHARALLVVILLLAASGCGARSELVSGDSETSFTCPDGSTAGAVSCGTITFADPVSYLVEAGGNHVVMADLNGDGRHDQRDSKFLAQLVEKMTSKPANKKLSGGLGVYRPNKAHGPFVHVDTRGQEARW